MQRVYTPDLQVPDEGTRRWAKTAWLRTGNLLLKAAAAADAAVSADSPVATVKRLVDYLRSDELRNNHTLRASVQSSYSEWQGLFADQSVSTFSLVESSSDEVGIVREAVLGLAGSYLSTDGAVLVKSGTVPLAEQQKLCRFFSPDSEIRVVPDRQKFGCPSSSWINGKDEVTVDTMAALGAVTDDAFAYLAGKWKVIFLQRSWLCALHVSVPWSSCHFLTADVLPTGGLPYSCSMLLLLEGAAGETAEHLLHAVRFGSECYHT